MLCGGDILFNASQMFTAMFPQCAASFTDVKSRSLIEQNAVYQIGGLASRRLLDDNPKCSTIIFIIRKQMRGCIRLSIIRNKNNRYCFEIPLSKTFKLPTQTSGSKDRLKGFVVIVMCDSYSGIGPILHTFSCEM